MEDRDQIAIEELSLDFKNSSVSQSGTDPNYNSIFDANSTDNVKVCIRVRPLNDREKASHAGKHLCLNQLDQNTVVLDRATDQKNFIFDFVGGEEVDQAAIFNTIAKPIADSCMQGYNGTIFAYGQTGAGKTFTIQGPEITEHQESGIGSGIRRPKKGKDDQGIIQRSFEYIFQNIEAQKRLVAENADGSEITFLIKASYLEIYNEQVADLLEPNSVNLNVREDIKKGVYIEGIREEVITSYRDMMQLVVRGTKNRHVGETSMNRESSRSHSVLTTIIESKSLSSNGVWNMKTARFHIIDLAGSERSKNTNAVGERLKEAGMINKSLSALGNVINSLVDLSEGKQRHIPYRDSKLTFILRDSLGGNSKTVIIANISPSALNMSETLSTLEFAKRAKQIKNKAVVNEDSSGTILILKNEIKRLRLAMGEAESNYQRLLAERPPDVSNQICQNCRMNNLYESLEDQGIDDSLLLDESDEENKASESEKTPRGENLTKIRYRRLALRVNKAESALELALETFQNQQELFKESQDAYEKQIQSQAAAYEALNQQANRDKMKLKYREDKVAKLESEHQVEYSDEIISLKNEIKLLNDQLEQEKSEQNARVTSVKAQLAEQTAIAAKNDVEAQNLPEARVIKELREYQQICSLATSEATTRSLQQAEKDLDIMKRQVSQSNLQLKDLQAQYDILLKQNVHSQEVLSKVRAELGREQVESSRLTESLEEAQERETQLQNELEGYQKDCGDLVDRIKVLETKGEETQSALQATIEELKADHSKQVQQLQNQYLDQIKQLSENNEQALDEMRAKCESDQKTQSLDHSEAVQGLVDDYLSQMQTLKSEMDAADMVKTGKLEHLEKENLVYQEKLVRLEKDHEESQMLVKSLKSKVAEEGDAKLKYQAYYRETKEKLDKTAQEVVKAKDQEANLQGEIIQLRQQNDSFELAMSSQREELELLEQSKKEMEANMSYLDESIDQMSIKHKEEVKLLQQEFSQLNEGEKSVIAKQIDELTDQLNAKQLKIDALSEALHDRQLACDAYESKLAEMKEQFVHIEEKLLAAEKLLHQRNNETLGAEKEQAESQVLLVEAQEFIKQREDELNRVGSLLQQKEQELTASKEEMSKLVDAEKFYKDENQHAIKQNDELRVQVKALEVNDKLVKQQMDEKSKQLEEKIKENKELLIRIEIFGGLRQEVARLEQEKDGLQFKRDERIRQLEKQIKQLKKTNQECEDQNQELMDKLGDHNKALDEAAELKRQVVELGQVKEELSLTKRKLDENNERHNFELMELHSQLETANEQLQQKQTRLSDLTSKYNSLSQQPQDLEDRIAKLQTVDLKQLEDKNSELVQDKQALEMEHQRIMDERQQEFNEVIEKEQQKVKNLLQEINDMQHHIDQITKSEELVKESQVKIKDDCQRRIHVLKAIIQKTEAGDEDVEKQRQVIKQGIAEALNKITDSEFSQDKQAQLTEQQMEIGLMVSQCICELSKLYEKQIVMEKRKASQDSKDMQGRLERMQRKLKAVNDENQDLKGSYDKVDPEKITLLDKQIKQVNSEKNELIFVIEKIQKKLADQTDLQVKYQQEKKKVQELKQLYEVRVQSQEQEIEQHQLRYKELEAQRQQEMEEYTENIEEIHGQMQQLTASNQDLKTEKAQVESKLKNVEQFVDMVQQNEDTQKDAMLQTEVEKQYLKQRLETQKYEFLETIRSQKQLATHNKNLQAEISRLELELNQVQVGHRNPQQKIQMTMKIKEENNQLREECLKLQEDLQRKISVVQRQSAQISAMESQSQKEQMIEHVLRLPQFCKVAKMHGLEVDVTRDVQTVKELTSLVDMTLEGFFKPDQLPPKPQTAKTKTPKNYSNFLNGPAKQAKNSKATVSSFDKRKKSDELRTLTNTVGQIKRQNLANDKTPRMHHFGSVTHEHLNAQNAIERSNSDLAQMQASQLLGQTKSKQDLAIGMMSQSSQKKVPPQSCSKKSLAQSGNDQPNRKSSLEKRLDDIGSSRAGSRNTWRVPSMNSNTSRQMVVNHLMQQQQHVREMSSDSKALKESIRINSYSSIHNKNTVKENKFNR